MHKAKLVIVGLLAIAAIIIIIQNTAAVETRLLFITVTMPRAVLLMLVLAVGFVLGLLFALMSKRKKEPSSPS